jgi:hypothetical protein
MGCIWYSVITLIELVSGQGSMKEIEMYCIYLLLDTSVIYHYDCIAHLKF